MNDSQSAEFTIAGILPQKGTQEFVQAKRFAEFDEVKILTGRTPEKVTADSAESFDACFGLNSAMKAFQEFAAAMPLKKMSFEGEDIDPTLDDIFLAMLPLRKRLRESNPTLSEDEIEYEVFKQACKDFLVETPSSMPSKSYVDRHESDRLLNIGDPHQRINILMDEPRITTIDYESGEEAGPNLTRTVEDVTNPIDDSLRPGVHMEDYFNSIKELDDSYQQVPEGEDYDCDWVFGFTDKQTGEKIPGVNGLVHDAKDAGDKVKRDPSTENIQAAQAAWDRVGRKLTERRQHYFEVEKRDVAKPNYDTSEGLHPIDYLAKSVYHLHKAGTDGFAVLNYYRQNVYPQLIHEFLEDLADAHTKAFDQGPKVTEHAFNSYRRDWHDFLESRGFEPEQYNPYTQDSRFADMLSEFFLLKGTRALKNLDPELYEKIEEHEKGAVNLAFPTKKKSQESKFIKAMFPFTQELPAQGYERVLASWSVSAHMFPKMSTDEMIDLIWPELDRLLAQGGKCIIFPIGHYGESPEWVMSTIKAYNEKYGGKLVPTKHGSGQRRHDMDESFLRDEVLIITK